jgi:transposase-like protein
MVTEVTVDCPKCGSGEHCKDGIVKGRQRHLCKACRHRYTVVRRSGTADATIKRQALQLYLEGLGFRSIGRILKFSNVAILQWIRAFGEQLEAIKRDDPVAVMELDEMHSYIGSKKTIAGYGLLLIEMGGASSTAYWVRGTQQQDKNYGIR